MNFFYCHVSFFTWKIGDEYVAPLLFKLCKDCLTGIGQGATVFAADFPIVNKI
jgi:hypothetical protein